MTSPSPIQQTRRRGAIGMRSHLRLGDVVGEAAAGILQRPGRSTLTMIGTVLGIGTFVSILGVTRTAAGQIGTQFSRLSATEAVATFTGDGAELAGVLDPAGPLKRINGVVDAGTFWQVPASASPQLATLPGQTGQATTSLSVIGASPGLLTASGATLSTGVLFNSFHEDTDQPVALLGATAAEDLGLDDLVDQTAIFLNGSPYTVLGILRPNAALPQIDLSVVVPASVALAQFGPPNSSQPAEVFIRTRLGAAPLVAQEAPLALEPEDPSLFTASAIANPTTLARSIDATISWLLLLLASVAIVVGAFGIADTTLVSVLERTGEIGLRRALGARRRHIAIQFVAESGVLGLVGGLVGTAIGVAAVVVVSVLRHWTAILSPLEVLPGPLAGCLVGLLAGAYPAWRSSTIEPSVALHR